MSSWRKDEVSEPVEVRILDLCQDNTRTRADLVRALRPDHAGISRKVDRAVHALCARGELTSRKRRGAAAQYETSEAGAHRLAIIRSKSV